MTRPLTAFKAYDVRGKVPEELDENLAHQFGLAYANVVRPQGKVAVGRDIRESSESISRALIRGLCDGGVNVVDAGLCGTETIYFAAAEPGMGGGVMVTASHNPKDHNGLKPVREKGIPLTGQGGLTAIRDHIATGRLKAATPKGSVESHDYTPAFVARMTTLVPPAALPALKVVMNPGNGCAGLTAKALLAAGYPVEAVWLFDQPDGSFPNGIPNPLLPECRESTAKKVRESGAGLGIAWDGDFDRCFFFDGTGRFIEGYYLVGLLAEAILADQPGSTIIYDPRLYWNTLDVVARGHGKGVMSRTGHAFIKETMRKHDGVYGGEMSAHHYFREFSYCDSGMLPWLLVLKIMKQREATLAELVDERLAKFPCSGEINFEVNDSAEALRKVMIRFAPQATGENRTDGISFDFNGMWRFNVRSSNTEPLLRLNVESRGNVPLMEEKTAELKNLLQGC